MSICELSDIEQNKEEVTLPKSTLNKLIKDVIHKKGVLKVEKGIYDLMDKLTVRYISHISEVASNECNLKGKKTLNVDHIIDALKSMGMDNHIKSLQKELDINQSQEAIELGRGNSLEMKDKINKKKQSKTKKKKLEVSEDLINEQKMLFEMSRVVAINEINTAGIDTNLYASLDDLEPNKKRRIEQIEDKKEEEENFD